eukprot:1158415-Pelagomonas_calceolata.AAC.2
MAGNHTALLDGVITLFIRSLYVVMAIIIWAAYVLLIITSIFMLMQPNLVVLPATQLEQKNVAYLQKILLRQEGMLDLEVQALQCTAPDFGQRMDWN